MINLYLHKTEHGKRLREIDDEELKEGLSKGEIETVRRGLYRQVNSMQYKRRDMVAEKPAEEEPVMQEASPSVRKKRRGRPRKDETQEQESNEDES